MVLWQVLLCATVLVSYGKSVSEDGPSVSFFHTSDRVERDAEASNRDYTGVKSTKRGGRKTFVGGCINKPVEPIYGHLRCSPESGCIATCKPNYKFPNGVEELVITCHEKVWRIRGTDWTTTPPCEPICMPECQNGGICIAPDQCNCTGVFEGLQCQFENKPCMDFPFALSTLRKRCDKRFCTLQCVENFEFPDGSAIANLACKNGVWVPTRNDWVSIPDCRPICKPRCMNGGNCLPNNVCQCPQEYRGPQCQYSANACASKDLVFNGAVQCMRNLEGLKCTLDCVGGTFEYPPATEYICTYDTGVFKPEKIPQCVYTGFAPDSFNSSYTSHFNHSWSVQDVVHKTMVRSWKSSFKYNAHKFIREHYRNTSAGMDHFSVKTGGPFVVDVPKMESKTCFVWGKTHYKTFDDKIYSFDSGCAHILVQDSQDSSFAIAAQSSPTCATGGHCFRIVRIFLQNKEYILSMNDEGVPEFRSRRKTFPIPIYIPGIRVDTSAHFVAITLDLVGIKLKWDGLLLLEIEASAAMWNRTMGLCGTMNGNINDELISKNGYHAKSIAALANSWKVEDIGQQCDEHPTTENSCTARAEDMNAYDFCSKLLSDHRFELCSDTITYSELEAACMWEYCACKGDNQNKCACDTMNVYVRQCAHKGITSLAGWRNEETCPMSCDKGRVYLPCGPILQPSCGYKVDRKFDTTNCEEGCFCPDGTVLQDGKCITPEECPCRLRGKLFKPGTRVAKGCNTCTCTSGTWSCTQSRCSARCAVIGDPHYMTFDGKHYDFMGKCKYYLMKGDNYSIEGENVGCSGAISESMGFIPSDTPSCTKTVTINYEETWIKLKQNQEILVNGNDLTKLPTLISNIRIRAASSLFLVVDLPNELQVWWDGISRVYINAPPQFYGKTWGLCGTFTSNQKDDFSTPEGDIETAIVPFANKWKTSEECSDVTDQEPKHSCELNLERREMAEEHCSKIHNSSIFSDCHWHVDPTPFYRNCLYDMCACDGDLKTCLCPMLSAYAKECAAAGVQILWRESIEECQMHCTGGQVYQICGNSCTRSCADISLHPDCMQECVEGCNCPEGETMDIHGECIPIGQCPCTIREMEVRAGYREVRPGRKSQELCVCTSGLWKCRPATKDEIRDYPPIGDLVQKCVASKHLEITDCEPVEQRTCRNMHREVTQSPATCKSGCVCKPGYVMDVPHGECIKEDACPCHHGGRSYTQGSVIQDDCNNCECKNGKWECTQRVCAGVCSAWGDSHYKTFDGKVYNFQGACDYIFAKGTLSTEESFLVVVQNVPCGTSGATCSKSVTLIIGSDANQESITLTHEKKPPNQSFKRIAIRSVELFIFLDVPDLGLVLQWDKGTRVYLRLDPKWKDRTKGLCGDYNNNSEDDFKTPSGGIAEASANLFADSWKKGQYCPEPKEAQDPCAINPERRLWALKKCNILKSSLFQRCHSEVEVGHYVENCIFDTCGCDSGGDCECFCTAVAAYAHECNVRGVHIKWRSQELCPLQCDEHCSSYSPCISTCPRETCDTMATLKDKLHMCAQDTCIEGCSFKPCPENNVYVNDSYTECVPKSMCKPFCAEIDGTTYYEGDKVSSTDCQTCFCTRGKVICSGDSCTSIMTTASLPKTQSQQCVNGWSIWINNDVAVKGKKTSDIEPLPLIRNMENAEGAGICEQEDMVNIKCRSVKDHLHPKETGLDVECSLERGLYCTSTKGKSCIDFEISVLCKCPEQATKPLPITSESPTTFEWSDTTATVEMCDPKRPNKLHPTNCHMFLQCTQIVGGIDYVEQTCGPDQLYNPKTLVCDFPANVIVLRPECSLKETTKGVYEWTTPAESTSTPIPFTESTPTVTVARCKDSEVWSDCAIKCDKACDYYHDVLVKEGYCQNADCVPGCVSRDRPACGLESYFKDIGTCVDISQCTCRSPTGKPVSPGQVIRESKCQICQCVNNFYMCENSCTTTEEYQTELTTTPSTTTTVIIIPSTITPPKKCDSNLFMSLLRPLISSHEISFNASSTVEPLNPENLVIGKGIAQAPVSGWRPEQNGLFEWLDVIFEYPEPIYGVAVQGIPVNNQFVTSYNVMYSENKFSFTYITNDKGEPYVFHGPLNSLKPLRQIFEQPIEARVVRIKPQTWHNGIAMKIELFGCQEYTTTISTEQSTPFTFWTTPATVMTSPTPMCENLMGVDNGLIQPEQISSSPSYTNLLPNLRLTSMEPWRPKLNNRDQYVQLDFLGPRNLTGIITAGGVHSWTSAYKVLYSMDGRDWNSIINREGSVIEFLGNVNDNTEKKNLFERPLHARYLRIQPTKWHQHISLKVEILGCFEPYPQMTSTTEARTVTPTTPETVITTAGKCNVCHGVELAGLTECPCEKPQWWNGQNCVAKEDCLCIFNDMSYSLGAVYNTADCKRCICSLGGVSSCSEMKCNLHCNEPGDRPVLVELCTCVCKPCPPGTKLCPTFGTCVNSTSWCDGVDDCIDDETNCTMIETTFPTPQTSSVTVAVTSELPSSPSPATEFSSTTVKPIPPTRKPPQKCPPVKCSHGYKVVYRNKRPYNPGPTQIYGGVKGRTSHFKKSFLNFPKFHNHTIAENEDVECQQFTCIPVKPPIIDINKPEDCPEAQCPPGYAIVYEKMSYDKFVKCPRYSCRPPLPHEVTCAVVGRTFTTFDNTEYNYDICNHILAREMYDNKWYVTLERKCDHRRRCDKVLMIVIGNEEIVLYTDMHAVINGNYFTPAQVARLASRPGPYQVSCIGNYIKFYCRHYGFWVLWNMHGNVKIGVSRNWAGGVDGLCGYYDERSTNDKQLPSGQQARNTREFGNSWAIEESPECELQICPPHYREEAWKICNIVKDPTFSSCFTTDVDKFVTHCLESACNCLNENNTFDKCRCETLTNFVTDCEAKDYGVDLSNWRSVHDCPTDCPAPFVHKDCYKYECEVSCDNLKEIDPCPATKGMCFSGCFCPDGMVRNGKTCVLPTECRDCSCDVFGNSKLVTFDKRTFQSHGNCTYVLSRDVTRKLNGEHAGHSYEILATNANCQTGLCVVAVTVLFGKNFLRIGQVPTNEFLHSKRLDIVVDGFEVFTLPYRNEWMTLERTIDDNVRLLIPTIQLEIIVFQHNFAFIIKLPSHTYGERMEGLCGNCNVDGRDDLRKPDGEIAQGNNDFDQSWTVIEPPSGSSITIHNCTIQQPNNCTTLPPESDPCQKIAALPAFQACHSLIDPQPYIETCQETLCTGASYCDSLEAYARQCLTVDICPDWRTEDICPYSCPPYLQYQPCGSSCANTCNTSDEDNCAMSSTEGCFCSEGHVLHNNTCILKEKCFVCDDEGHVENDVWYPNKCTNCSCTKGVVNCDKIECPISETVCQEDMKLVPVQDTENDCCPKHMCIPIIKEQPRNCTDQSKPVCGFGQTMKATTDADGCQRFICECLPADDCPIFDVTPEAADMEPGIVKVMNNSGCCPRPVFVCEPEKCPTTINCPPYHNTVQKKQKHACCPDLQCEPPKDLCAYTTFPETNLNTTQVIPKKIGESWDRDVCTQCTCELVNNMPIPSCLKQECTTVTKHPDVNDYILDATLVPNQCCPQLERSACKVGDLIYNIGATWRPDPQDPCTAMECIQGDNGITKRVLVQQCNTTCEYGYIYDPPSDRFTACCGKCVLVGCLVKGQLKNVGETWYSPDHCTSYSCYSENGSVAIKERSEKCPEVDTVQKYEYVFDVRPVEGKCCPEFVRTGCRDNGNTYLPGEKWKTADKCIQIKCIIGENGVTKEMHTESCNKDCPLGSTYQEPIGDECCGKCKPAYCILGDAFYKPGDTWTEGCISYSCLKQGDQMSMIRSDTPCPDITGCPPEFIYEEACCKLCNISIVNLKGVCSVIPLNGSNTIRMFAVKDYTHGLCTNLNPIIGLKECRGTCDSSTYFNSNTLKQEANCHCCQGMEYEDVTVDLSCEDGYILTKRLSVPISCSCDKARCESTKRPSGTKIGVKG